MAEILKLLGLAYRAKKTLLGEDNLKKMSKLYFIFLANDLSDKSKERYLKKTYFYKLPYSFDFNSEQLSKAIGKKIMAVGIIDRGFSKEMIDKLQKEETNG